MGREEEQSAMDSDSEAENPNWSKFWSPDSSPNDPHEFGECMEDCTIMNGERNEKEMDCRRKEEEWERSIEEVASNQ